MTRAAEESAQAERTLQLLASISDRELATAIRVAVSHLVQAAEARRSDVTWRQAAATEQAAHTTLHERIARLASLPENSELHAVIAVVSPVLGLWWPETPASAGPVSAAVERLRAAAMHQPALVRDARLIVGGSRTGDCEI